MVLTEFDEEKYLEMMREEEWADGHAAGLSEGITQGHASGLKEGHASGLQEGYATGLLAGYRENLLSILEELGDMPEDVMRQIEKLDIEGMKCWSKLASKAASMDEFLRYIKKDNI